MGVDKFASQKQVESESSQSAVRELEELSEPLLDYAIDNDKDSVTLVHKGNIMKFTEGGFRDWGHQIAKKNMAL